MDKDLLNLFLAILLGGMISIFLLFFGYSEAVTAIVAMNTTIQFYLYASLSDKIKGQKQK